MVCSHIIPVTWAVSPPGMHSLCFASNRKIFLIIDTLEHVGGKAIALQPLPTVLKRSAVDGDMLSSAGWPKTSNDMDMCNGSG